MTNKNLADLILPNITKTIDDLRREYPKREVEGEVTRVAPSPTGYFHIGGMYQTLIDNMIARNSNGVFYVRIEDTDSKRKVDDAVELIYDTLKNYDLMPNEYQEKDRIVGNYGPYVQSERKEIYQVFIKYLIEIGRAYPCFCSKDKLDEVRERQERYKQRTGYYGPYSTCRKLSIDEAYERVKNGENYIIRFKSKGNFDEKFRFDDLVKGRLLLPENDEDFVIMKADGLPTYHFAHLVDDYLMGTTIVVRGEEWISSLPKHVELFNTFGFDLPKYIHTPNIMKKDEETGKLRKISKRKDPEASMSYYKEHGYPTLAVIESLMTIINTNYEQWHTNNPEKSYLDFVYDPKKMSASGGLYDLDKLINISKTVISKMTKEELCEKAYDWACSYNEDLKELIDRDRDYFMNIINIERCQKKPRKDIAKYEDIVDNIWFMYDDLYESRDKDFDWQVINDKEEIKNILDTYMDKYFNIDDKDSWFNGVRDLTNELGYCANMKEYKEDPSKYKGSVADISTVLRVGLTSKSMSPDLYEIMRLLGKDRILKRYKNI
ncbi:MAG: glutamate--tRNA ligase [Bacilli bacterium]|nr:glutamate--tRNA ligase [Bacilli bacterium]